MVAPGQQQLIRVLQPRVGLGKPLQVLRAALRRLRRARRKHPVLDGDDLACHRETGQEWVVVLGDQPGYDHVVGERGVDAVGLCAHRGLQFLERPRGEDPVADHCHRLHGRFREIEGHDLLGRVDGDRGQRFGGLCDVLERGLLGREPGGRPRGQAQGRKQPAGYERCAGQKVDSQHQRSPFLFATAASRDRRGGAPVEISVSAGPRFPPSPRRPSASPRTGTSRQDHGRDRLARHPSTRTWR